MGKRPLRWDGRLAKAAQAQAKYMFDVGHHTHDDGVHQGGYPHIERAKEAGYNSTFILENVSELGKIGTAKEVVITGKTNTAGQHSNGWWEDQSSEYDHGPNMVNPNLTRAGVGCYCGYIVWLGAKAPDNETDNPNDDPDVPFDEPVIPVEGTPWEDNDCKKKFVSGDYVNPVWGWDCPEGVEPPPWPPQEETYNDGPKPCAWHLDEALLDYAEAEKAAAEAYIAAYNADPKNSTRTFKDLGLKAPMTRSITRSGKESRWGCDGTSIKMTNANGDPIYLNPANPGSFNTWDYRRPALCQGQNNDFICAAQIWNEPGDNSPWDGPCEGPPRDSGKWDFPVYGES
jgi:hypothetical protein